MRKSIFVILALYAILTEAQPRWTALQCMQYAVEHNHEVRRAELELDNYKASKTSAAGRFLPAVDANIGAQYNFGRAIDPETNGYTDVSTFYNGYSVQISLPVFDGFNRLHALKAAKASVLMGHQALRKQQDQTALNVLQAYVNVVYEEGMVRMAQEKLLETELLLRQTRLLEEVGRKSAADVALVESQHAEADFEVTRQQNLFAAALLELKKEMAYPMTDSLAVLLPENTKCPTTGVQPFCSPLHPVLQQAQYQVETSKHEWNQARASLFPTLSLSAGLSTTYYKTLHTETASSFGKQFSNNMGEYVGVTLSIPIFNRLQTVSNIRKAKNNYQMACEAYEQKQAELEKLSQEAWFDWQGYLKQTAQMEKKVEADSLAYLLTYHQYEEGLSTAIDLHTTSAQLLNSKATLLQCRLMAMVKEQLVKYYQGIRIWTE
ncbi:MAG: TolC family protein [Prevotella sp.]|nr:TolC family protein [Prevotella sp.]